MRDPLLHMLLQIVLIELLRRKIDRHPQNRQIPPLPFRDLVTGQAQDQIAQGGHQAQFLGQGNELVRRDQATFRMAPADQRFQADHKAGFQVDLRLIMQLELVVADGSLQGDTQPDTAQGGAVHIRPVKLVALSAGLFRLIHGGIGIAHQFVRVFGIIGEQGNPDAGRDSGGIGADHDGLGNTFDDLAGHGGGRDGAVQIGDQGDKFITAQAGHCIAIAQAFTDAAGHRFQHRVPGLVSHRVVDEFKPVQIDEQYGKFLAIAARLVDGMGQPVKQKGPVRQARQAVIVGHMGPAHGALNTDR